MKVSSSFNSPRTRSAQISREDGPSMTFEAEAAATILDLLEDGPSTTFEAEAASTATLSTAAIHDLLAGSADAAPTVVTDASSSSSS